MNPYEPTSLRASTTIKPNNPFWSYRRSAWQGMLATIALPLVYSLFSIIYRMSVAESPWVELRRGLVQILLIGILFGAVGASLGLMTSFMGRIFLPVDPRTRSDETFS